jgi:hypothetical protein
MLPITRRQYDALVAAFGKAAAPWANMAARLPS